MKFFYTLVVFTLFSFSSFSQTNVSGTLAADAEWTLAGSPYTITSTVGVPAGVTLTIHPGVKVAGNFDLVVKGKIVANGSSAQPIEFTNLRLMFRSADLSLSTIRYVKFNNAGVQLADESQVQDVIKNSMTLVARNCTFDNRGYVRGRGISSGAILRLEDCSLSLADVYSYHPIGEKIEFLRSTITSSSLYAEGNKIEFNHCKVNNSNINIYWGGSVSISDSEVIKTSFPFYNNNGIVDFDRVSFVDSFLNLPYMDVTMDDCSVVSPSTQVTYLLSMGGGHIKNSTFEGHAGINAVNIVGGFHAGTIAIENVQFKNFNTILEKSNSSPLDVVISQTNFIGAAYTIKNTNAKDIDARNCYWGTSDEQVIKNKIIDYLDDLNYGVVNYGNFSTTPFLNPLPKPGAIYKGLHKDGTLLHWKKPISSSVAGFKVYKKVANNYIFLADAMDHDSVIVDEDFSGDFVVTAYDDYANGIDDQAEGHESNFSNVSVPFIILNDGQSASACGDTDLEIGFTSYYNFPGSSNLHLIKSLTPGFEHSDTVQSVAAGNGNHFLWSVPNTLTEERTFYYRIASDEFGIFSPNKSVKLFPSLQTDFTIESNCTPGGYRITTTALPDGATVTWTVGDGIISNNNTTSLIVTWSTAGEKSITLNASLNGCNITRSKQVTVALGSPFTKPAICSVEFDEASGNNKVSWNYIHPKLSAIKIYREEYKDEYALIATIQAGNDSYVDNTSIGSQRAYRYRISAVSTCGDETNMSDAVKSFHLRIGPGIDGDWNLDWEERTESGKIEIYRRTDAAWEKIGDLPTIHTSFTDVNPPHTAGFYQTKLVTSGSSCLVASNIVFNGVTSTEEESVNFQTYPNPTTNKITFYHSSAGQYEFIDAKGISMLQGTVNNGENQVSVASLPQGIYLLTIRSGSKVYVTRVFKKEL